MISAAPKLREELEIIRGMDDTPLIFDPVTGHYHRISPAAEVIVKHLDGSRTKQDLVEFLAGGQPATSAALEKNIDPFLETLDKSGLLVGSELPDKARQGDRVRSSMFMPRVVLTRSLPRLLEPPARLLRKLPVAVFAVLLGILALGGYAFGGYTLIAGTPPIVYLYIPAFITAVVVQLLLVLVHELAHAVVAQVLKVPVRGLGVALLFYFMPVAYVDRTDAYRLQGRGGRVALALAGITSDGIMCGLTGLVALNTGGFVQATAIFLLGLQMIGVIVNVNPLLPSDGYSAAEAGTGLIDPRGRAFTVLKSVLRRRELPPYLASISRRAKASYFVYGVVCVAYGIVLLGGTLYTLLTVARLLFGLGA
jgi:putative peptide zinc metalloprotease protein